MLFTDYGQVKAWLETVTAANSEPALPQGEIDRAMTASLIRDADGNTPQHPDYLQTWNAYYAAAILLDVKAAMAVATGGGIVAFSSEGSSVTRERVSAMELSDLASRYRQLAFRSGGITVIDLGSQLGALPRSAIRGVTSNVDRRRARRDAW